MVSKDDKHMLKEIVFFLAISLLLACEPNEYQIPDETSITHVYPEFSIQSAEFSGIYVNYDSDAMIFQYEIHANETKLGPEDIKGIARQGKWELLNENVKERNVSWLIFRRLDEEKSRYGDLHSLEILKIVSCGKFFIFGGIQADFRELDQLIENELDGGKWYRSNFWPLFSKHVDEVCIRYIDT